MQNIFAKNLRGISLNYHYIILCKNPRDVGQISRLGSQLGALKLMKEVYSDICNDPYAYLLVDIHPTTQREYMLRTKIFPGQDTIVYKE